MIRLTLLLATFATLIGCSTPRTADVRGFAGYSFSSGYDAVRDDMNFTGYDLIEADENGLWYAGDLNGYPVQFYYEFLLGGLTGGYIDVLELSTDSWLSVNQYLLDTYPLAITETCKSIHEFCRTLCTADAKIVHLLTSDREVHVVRYYERSRRNDCHSELGIDVALNTDIKP